MPGYWAIGGLKIYRTIVNNSKVRNPIAICLYDEAYSVIIYQMNILDTGNIEKHLYFSFKDIGTDFKGTFDGFRDSMILEFLVNVNPIKVASPKTYVNIYGDSLSHISNGNNVINYCINLKSFCIKYSNNPDIDMYVTNFEKSFFKKEKEVKTSILFFKKNGKTFLLLMMPQKSDIVMPSNLLYDILQKTNL